MINQQREWLKSSNGKHRFLINDGLIGELLFKKMEAFATIKTQHYTIRKKGFWKTQVEILDEIGHVVLETRSKNWYGSTSIITFNNREFTLDMRTKGGLEWAIVDNRQDLLTYQIVTEDDVKMVKMTAFFAKIDPILDFFLWFTLLKSPYSKTNSGGDGSMVIIGDDFGGDGGDGGDGGGDGGGGD
jgi:hypothetical protein